MFNRDLLPNPQAYYSQYFAFKGNKTKPLVLCCFHHDKTASLSLDLSTGRFNCFGCGASGGDVLDFHQLKTGLSFVESCKDLGAWVDTSTDTPEQLAARKAKVEQANKEYKARQAQAAKDEISQAQAFIPLVAAILKQCTKPMLEPPYCVIKRINSHNLTTIAASDIQKFILPKDPSKPTAKPITVCYGFNGLLTVAILETLDGEPVALQVFDGVANNKGKYARWIIGKPVVMGAYYRLGDFTAPSLVLITEGIADAISCYEATGYPCLAAISKGQLGNAAQAVKAKYSQALIVLCGDNDADGGGEVEANKAAKAVNGLAVIPKDLDGVKDFNDLHQQHSLEVVKKMIDEAIQTKKAVPPSQDGTASVDDDLARESIDDNAASCELPDPIPLRKTLSDVMPFTEDLLPTVLSHFAFDEADRMPAAPSFVGTSLVTALGSVIGASCGIKPKQKDDWLIVPNLWGGIVANPTQKKTPAIDSGMRILSCIITEAITDYEAELKQYKKDVLSYDTDLDSLKSELKSSANPNAKKTPKHTKEELIDLICKMEEEAPCPPMLRRYKTNDSTVAKLGELEQQNPNGILVLRDELIGLLSSLDKEGNEGDRAFYLEGFNGTGSYDTDRIGRGHIFIQNHCLSVFGGIQPDKLIAYLEQAYSGLGNDGLLQRFQLLVYPDPIEWQYRDRYPNHEAFKAVLEIFSRLSGSDFVEFGAHPIDEYNKRPYFRFTLDAQAFYVDWTRQLNAQKIPNEENTIIQQHLGKYDRLLPALALIFHLVDCVSNHTQGQVGLESIKRAALWCEYLETHARRIYGLLLDGGMKSAIALSSKILKIVKSANRPTAKTDETSEDWLNNGFVLRDIRRKQWQHLTDDTAIQKALVILEDNYWIVSKMQTSTEKGGRPTTRYFISQKLKTSIPPTAKTDETQKTNNSDSFFEQKTGFGSFGSTSPDTFQNLKNNDVNSSLDEVFVNSANSTNWSMDI